MKTLLRLAAAATILTMVLALSACSTAVRTVSAEPAMLCEGLSWDGCAVAPNCRHTRAWEAAASEVTSPVEVFACEQRYEVQPGPAVAFQD